ncbi:MAG: hypothetical protein WCV55_03280 [Candidatus Paceibacterota bacterium]
MRMMQKDVNKKLDQIAVKFTRWIGSPSSIFFHSLFFIACFVPYFFGGNIEKTLLFLTTVVSLEAIYLAILIQMTVNRNIENLIEVGKDITEIQEDVDEIQKDVDEIQEDVDEIQKDVDEIQEDVDEIEQDELDEDKKEREYAETLQKIQNAVENIMKDIDKLKMK